MEAPLTFFAPLISTLPTTRTCKWPSLDEPVESSHSPPCSAYLLPICRQLALTITIRLLSSCISASSSSHPLTIRISTHTPLALTPFYTHSGYLPWVKAQ
ncbi:hypothetical protein LY78DRAFT_405284 [Colletotrichum sublineola]|nr:hypothetical protein LY78DRAFT_405284 [Colletotrichum sublineola]